MGDQDQPASSQASRTIHCKVKTLFPLPWSVWIKQGHHICHIWSPKIPRILGLHRYNPYVKTNVTYGVQRSQGSLDSLGAIPTWTSRRNLVARSHFEPLAATAWSRTGCYHIPCLGQYEMDSEAPHLISSSIPQRLQPGL
jgi:hypothetical protein